MELYDPSTSLSCPLSFWQEFGAAVDGTQTQTTIELPQQECRNCTLSFQRQAMVWGGTYIFYSCAIVDIIEEVDVCNGCSGHGSCVNGECQCDKLYSGQYCEKYSECEEDDDCGEFGKCFEVESENSPIKQCYCQEGYHGVASSIPDSPIMFKRTCDVASNLTIGNPAEWPEEYDFSAQSAPTGLFKVFWKIVGDEIEFAVSADTDSFVGLGYRPTAVIGLESDDTDEDADGEGEGEGEGEGAGEGEVEG